jgi:RNA polymerase sigma-70 factor (ECF subfamily)
MDEKDLLIKARAGDVDAFSELVRLHQSRVRAFLGRFIFSREAVDDVAQETFLAAFRSLQAYDERWPLRSWLFGIARNQALIFLRKECVRLRRENEDLEAAMTEWCVAKAEDRPVEKDATFLAALEQCIQSLPGQSAQVVRSFYYEAQAAGQIGAKLGRSENAVRLWLFRIRQQLRECIEARAGVPEGGA